MRLGDKRIQRDLFCRRCRPSPRHERLPIVGSFDSGGGESHGTQGISWGSGSDWSGCRRRSPSRQRPWQGRPCWRFADGMRDFDTVAAGPFDDATARLQLVDRPSGTTAVLHVRGVDPSVAGRTFGAHLHNGPCGTNAPAAAGGHYNADAHAGHTPVVVSSETEVWLDFTVDTSWRGGLEHGRALPRAARHDGPSSCTPPPPTPPQVSPGLVWRACRWSGDAASGRARRPGRPRLGSAGPAVHAPRRDDIRSSRGPAPCRSSASARCSAPVSVSSRALVGCGAPGGGASHRSPASSSS